MNANAASSRPLTIVRAADISAPDQASTPAWLVHDLWGSGAVGVIGGPPKSCKSWLALELAVAVASGRPCLGRFPVPLPGPVLLYAAEDTPHQVRQRIQQLCQARGASLDTLELDLILEPTLRIDRPPSGFPAPRNSMARASRFSPSARCRSVTLPALAFSVRWCAA
jgi:hypothetical protein